MYSERQALKSWHGNGWTSQYIDGFCSLVAPLLTLLILSASRSRHVRPTRVYRLRRLRLRKHYTSRWRHGSDVTHLHTILHAHVFLSTTTEGIISSLCVCLAGPINKQLTDFHAIFWVAYIIWDRNILSISRIWSTKFGFASVWRRTIPNLAR